MLNLLSRGALVAAVALPLAACESATDPDFAETTVLLSRGAVEPAASIGAALLKDALGAPVSLDAVTSIDVVITRIQLLRAGADPEDDGDWVELSLAGDAAVAVDLRSLPLDGGIPIAQAELDVGQTYAGLRLFFAEPATITFAEPVSVGPITVPAGQHDLFIPSGAQTGIKVLEPFTVSSSGDDVIVEFDANASVRQIVVAGATGRIILPPVLGIEEEQG